jgi:hypothetical protein
MTFHEKLAALAALAAVLGIAIVARPSAGLWPATPRSANAPTAWLLVVALALIAVGVVSATLLRHVVQIAPLVLAAVIAAVRPRWAACVAAPLFVHWLLVMIAIWLFLLGVARIFTGTFSPAEVVLTIVIGGAALLGLLSCYRRRHDTPSFPAICGTALFAFLQFAAMWLSTQPVVAAR